MAEPISVAIPITQKWTERDQIGRGAILLALSNTLFDVYCFDSYTAKSLWGVLDRKYNTEEQGLEKYSVSKFMRYQMVEDRSIAEQTHEIINLEHALADAEMKLPEKFLVMSIVDKFSKSWENFGMTLKHQKGRLSLDDLMIAINIKEEHRNQTHKMPVEQQPRANLIVGKQKVNKINSNSKAINKSKASKNKKPKANKPCWNCGQVGHWVKLCHNKKAKTGQAVVNMVVGGSSGASTSGATGGYVSVQPELLTIYELYDWLIDTGANVHVYADKSLFVSYQAISGKTVSMGNSSTAEVLEIGSVDLKFPSGRILSLKRVHHVPTVRRNIISGSVIVREGYELAFKFNKVVIQQFGIFVGKGYLDDGLFKVRVDNNKIDVSDSIILNVESSTLWHSRDSEILDLVHTDTCEFNAVLTRDHRYFITFIADCSRYCYVFLMKIKDEALDKFILFKNEAETQTGKKLKRLRSDRGGEYESSKFNEYCQTFGIINEETPLLLLTSGLPKYLWGEALNTACHILNRVPLKHNTSTPFELWKAKVLIPEHKQKKLGPKTVDVVFLGYVETSYALRFLVIKSEIPGIEVNTIVKFRDTEYLQIFRLMIHSTSIPEHVEKMSNVGVSSSSSNQTHEESDEPRRSKRARIIKDFGSDFVTYNIEDDSITFKDAMASSEAKEWKEAVKSEMDSIVSNGTWVLVDLPPGCTTIGSRFTTIRVLIALASVYKLPIHQMDVKIAFLYGELEEEIYMDQPEGFVVHGSCLDTITEIKSFLKNKFEMKDMGEANVILGIKLTRTTDEIAISQSHYVEKIIEKFGYQNSRIAKTPYDPSVALFKNESGVSVAQLRFAAVLEGYSDASWIAKNSGSNECSRYVFTLGGGAVSWKSAKQTLITRSTFEADLCALDTTSTEAEWLFGLLSQLPIVSQPLSPIAVYCDSQTTVAKVRSRKYNQKTKRHIQVRLKSIRALVSDRVIGIDFVGTKDNVADPLTRGLNLSQVHKSRLGMGLKIHE
ncbi:UNVERIFIED_CONTAM: Retrovirus-related Pol polyprotein from transposon TNT 1-94 [Sesamum indicum]